MAQTRLARTDDLRKALSFAVHEVMTSDRALLKQRVSERAVMFHLGRYLAERLALPPSLSIDVEYNRATPAGLIKRLLSDDVFEREIVRQHKQHELQRDFRYVLPDLIVHDREAETNNVLVVEIKIDASENAARLDVAKLASIRRQLAYRNAVL